MFPCFGGPNQVFLLFRSFFAGESAFECFHPETKRTAVRLILPPTHGCLVTPDGFRGYKQVLERPQNGAPGDVDRGVGEVYWEEQADHC